MIENVVMNFQVGYHNKECMQQLLNELVDVLPFNNRASEIVHFISSVTNIWVTGSGKLVDHPRSSALTISA